MFNPKEFIDKTNYRWQVQAHSNAIPGLSSRRTGKLAERPFYLVKLRPVEVEFPRQNAQIKGSEAILNPVTATWSSVDKVRKAQFVLSRIDVNPPQVIIKIPSDAEFSQKKSSVAPRNVLLDTADGLRAGKYQIIVYAETLDGIDISNTDRKNRRTFDILPVEPLEKAQNLVARPAVFNREYLSVKENPKCITLSWSKVPKATDYFVEIKDKKGRALLVQNVKNGTSYKIDFTTISAEDKIAFSKGRFSWTVYGVRRIDTDNDGKVDKIFQEGIPAESDYRKLVSRKIKANQTADLLKTLNTHKLEEEEAQMFYNRFDKAFMELYPGFVTELNKLLLPECQLEVPTTHDLTTEIRIFALMRLGVTDSQEIATLLHYSTQTIYNYKSGMRAKAINRDTFESDINQLCHIINS